MKVTVLGAGAMGCLFGGLLAENGIPVWLVDIWEEHVDAINQRGLTIEGIGGERVIKNIRATTDLKEVSGTDLLLVFVKSTATEAAIKGAKALVGSNTLVLTLQNGLGNVEKLQKVVGEDRVIAGVTSHGSTLLGPGHIRHAGEGDTYVGEVRGGKTGRIEGIADLFNNAGIKCSIADNILSLIWSKLVVNVGINAITAITGLRNGEILQHPGAEEILELAVNEAVEVARARGIQLQYPDPVGHVKEVCRLTAQNRSSMLQDVLNRRKTEIDMINGAVVREGQKVGVDTPVNRVLTNLVTVIQDIGKGE